MLYLCLDKSVGGFTLTQSHNLYHCSEVNSGFFYKSAEDREKLVAAERKFVDDRVMQVIELKKKVIWDEFWNHS